MLFWLKKTLTLPFLPLPFALAAGVAGILLLRTRRWERAGKRLVTAAILALLVFSNKGVARLLIGPLEARHPAAPEAASTRDLPPALAACRHVVVLGGGHGESPALSRVNELVPAALARLAEAIRILRLLPPDTQLIVSGHGGFDQISHAQILAEAAISLGVAPDRILRMDEPRDTEDEANSIRRRLGDTPFALVTSAWHMPRAMSLCAGAGLHPVACPADFMLKPGAERGLALLQCDLAALDRSTKAIREYLGLLWTTLRGRGAP